MSALDLESKKRGRRPWLVPGRRRFSVMPYRGKTMPIGTCRSFDASVAYSARARIEAHFACDPFTQRGLEGHTISRTVSERTVKAILSRFGCPFTSDSANFAACSTVTLGGIGGVNGSTTASTRTGPSTANA